MLKKIPNRLSPELMILMETGHGDETVIADGNFPAASCAPWLIRLSGYSVPAVLEAILQLFPLDPYVKGRSRRRFRPWPSVAPCLLPHPEPRLIVTHVK